MSSQRKLFLLVAGAFVLAVVGLTAGLSSFGASSLGPPPASIGT